MNRPTFVLFVCCMVVLSSCSLDKRLYRNGFLIESCQHKNTVENSEKLENPTHDDAEMVEVDSCGNGKNNPIAQNASQSNFANIEFHAGENELAMVETNFAANYNAGFDNSTTSKFEDTFSNRPQLDDTSKVHPILTGASVGTLMLTSVFAGTLIYNLVIGMAPPFWFPAASLFAVLSWIAVLIAFLIGKRIVNRAHRKWRQSKFNKIAFALLLLLGVIYVVFFIFFIFYLILYLL